MHKYNIAKRPVIVPVGPSIAYVELTRGLWYLIDAEDAERVGLHNWYAQPCKKVFYARAYLPRGSKSNAINLSDFIMGKVEGKTVDHIYRKTIYNRKSQLRHLGRSHQQMNRGNPSNNPSGVKGVSWNRFRNKWHAKVGIAGNLKHIGLYDTIFEAELAYKLKVLEVYGDLVKDV